jgi:2-oxoglutarate ferredoxin oxidoreductase subunit beta
VSFVAQVVEWIPELLYEVLKLGFKHKGFSFIRILQRCPHFMQDIYTNLMTDPANILLLTHDDGMPISDGIARLYKSQELHDPTDIQRAREISAMQDKVPIGILYRNPDVPTYDEIRAPERAPTIGQRQDLLESAFDKFGIFPTSNIEVISGGNGDGARADES